jgi:hypothetical protein
MLKTARGLNPTGVIAATYVKGDADDDEAGWIYAWSPIAWNGLRNWPAKAAAIRHPAAAEFVSECLRLIDQRPAQLTLPLDPQTSDRYPTRLRRRRERELKAAAVAN